MEPVPPTTAPSRAVTFSALRHRNFRLYFIGQGLSLIGTWSQGLAISWLVWRLTRSAVWLGGIGFIVQFPILLFGLPGGYVADHFDRLRSVAIMQILCMLQAFALAFLTLTGRIALWEVVLLSALLGTVYAFEFPTRLALVTDMVGKQELLNAVSLNAVMIHATRIAGPVVAGIIVAWKGEGVCFLFNGFTFLFLIAALALMNRAELAPQRREASAATPTLEGMRYAGRHPHLLLALILLAVVSTIGMSYLSLLPIFADDIYRGGSVHLGWMMGASGTGALAGALWLAGKRSEKGLLPLAASVAVIFSLALAIFSEIALLWVALPLLGIMGFCLTIHFSCLNTLLQRDSPDHLRGRMMSLFTMIMMGLSPAGMLLAGFMASSFGAPHTMLAGAGLCLVAAAAIWVRARKLRDG